MMVFLMIPRALIKYFVKRLIFFVITSFAAVTINFLIPRLIPGDPISTILLRMEQQGRIIPGGEDLVEIYKRRFGLEGDLFTQYIRYLQRLLQGDLGFSIMAFPMTVQEIIFRALPWTIGLLSIATVLSWVLGNLLGAFLGWVRGGKAAAFITYLALGLNQVPYYFLALVLVFLFAYMIPIFPSQGAFAIGRVPSISIEFVIDVIYHSTLPALSIIIVSLGGWMITMRSM
ncbi:MAG: ABC transporter permease, partial [Thermoprotei archaeon]